MSQIIGGESATPLMMTPTPGELPDNAAPLGVVEHIVMKLTNHGQKPQLQKTDLRCERVGNGFSNRFWGRAVDGSQWFALHDRDTPAERVEAVTPWTEAELEKEKFYRMTHGMPPMDERLVEPERESKPETVVPLSEYRG